MAEDFEDGFKAVSNANPGLNVFMDTVSFTRKESDVAYSEMCGKLGQQQLTVLVDMTWGGWVKGRRTAKRIGLPVVRIQVPTFSTEMRAQIKKS